MALDRSEGVLDFTLKLARARVTFDPVKISEETIIKNIKKLTRYDQVEIKEDRIRAWLDQGAQPSETVRRLLNKKNLQIK